MRAKNKTPFLFGAAATSRSPPTPSVTLVVKGTFRLRPGEPVAPLLGLGEQGSLSGDVFEPDDDGRTGALLYSSDFADYKPRADVLVRARCHTPGKRPMTECPVRVTLGAWSRSLRVVGRRVWLERLLGASPSDPAPFTEMPLDLGHAFGGPDFAENPAGKGRGTAELHNIESPGDVVRSKTDRIAPAGFGPISPFWPQRKAKVGKEYGKSYAQKRAPHHAEDFDWSYFNAAPPEQQIPHLRGDEELSFLNLHPEAQSFSARLPGLRVRAFVHDDEGHFREVPMALDTVLADLEREVLVLTWRGVETVREDDLADVSSALVVSEPLSEAPAPAAGFRDELVAFEADPVEFERRKGEIIGRRAPISDPESSDPAWSALKGKLGELPNEQRERVRLALQQARDIPTREGLLGDKLAEAISKAPAGSSPPVAFPRKPGSLPYVPLGHKLRPLRETAARVREMLARKEVAPHVADRKIDLTPLAQLAALEDDPFVRSLDPYSFRPGGPGSDEPGPGADLSGRDLSGQDLSGKDLTGANLEGALLMGARLAKAVLWGARLQHAIFHEADLTEADLSSADLTQANLTGARAERAVFEGACVEQAIMERASLSGANFSRAKGQYTVFSGACLASLVLRGADLHKAFFDGADLTGADGSGSTLTACRFLDARAVGLDLAGATLDQSTFERADLANAVFAEARGQRVVFRSANLEGADLSHVVLDDAFFDEASARRVSLRGARLRGARLYRAILRRADAAGADLLGADLRKADLTGASFVGASLFQAKLRLARREGADFTDADLTRVVTDERTPPERRTPAKEV